MAAYAPDRPFEPAANPSKEFIVLTRREMLRASVMATSALALAQLPSISFGADFTKPVKESEGLTAYQRDQRILVRYDNIPVLSYRASSDAKYPYFYPLSGPKSGLSLTTESALPYPHHRGLWLGCEPLNGGDYWADNGLKSGQIKSTKLEIVTKKAVKNSVTFVQECQWVRKGSHPFDDKRRYTITRPTDGLVFIDSDIELTAAEDVSIKSAKHAFFAMRAASDISPAYGGTLMNSEGGIGAKGTYGKTADWCGYFGKRRFRPDVTEGIVIMNHPDNFGGKCPWFTRDYGHLSASPLKFQKKPFKLAEGSSFKLSYRVVLFVGTPREANLDGIFKSWLNA
jgi:hypothetical protein